MMPYGRRREKRASHSTAEELRVEHGIASDGYLRMKFIVEPDVPLCEKGEGGA
jgi:hypothetical protein